MNDAYLGIYWGLMLVGKIEGRSYVDTQHDADMYVVGGTRSCKGRLSVHLTSLYECD